MDADIAKGLSPGHYVFDISRSSGFPRREPCEPLILGRPPHGGWVVRIALTHEVLPVGVGAPQFLQAPSTSRLAGQGTLYSLSHFKHPCHELLVLVGKRGGFKRVREHNIQA